MANERHSTAAIMRRAFVVAVIALLGTTVQSTEQVPAKRPPANSTRDVRVNRTVPRVPRPALAPVFSAAPTDLELRGARVFPEPLLPLGSSSPAENEALAGAVARYASVGEPLDVQPFLDFLRAHPSSAWRASLQANLGGLHRAAGYHTRALKAWDEAWTSAKDDRSPVGRAIADIAAAGALDMLATMGQRTGLDRWLQRIDGRAMTGPAAMRAERAREVRALIERHPERSIASGPKALEILLAWQSKAKPDMNALVSSPLPPHRQTAAGTTLAELQALAAKARLSMTAVRREAGAAIVTPAIVHLGFDHFSAVLEEVNGRYRVRDPALGGEVWMPREALAEEMSGYALIPRAAEVPGWHELTAAEATEVVGHSCPPGLPDPDECLCEDSEPGMPTYSLHPVQASVLLADSPLGYIPPRGPSVNLQLRYNHREANQPQVFTFANLGAKWTANWIAYVEEVPWSFFYGYIWPLHAAVHVPQGGVERYVFPDVQGVYPRHYRSAAVLTMVSTSPIRYERRHTDGSTEIYDVSDGGVPGQRRVFLSAIVDPHGQTLQFTWDGQLRLVALTDALGQVTTLQYEDPDPLKVTSVTDPFGRLARFTYDGEGHLASVTDVIALTSSFQYSASDFITRLETPYGVTGFRAPSIGGQNARAVEAVDPVGAVERVEFWYTGGPVPATAPPEEVPPGFEDRNSELNTIMSLHWAKGRNTVNVQEATAWRWLIHSLDGGWDPGWAVGVPSTVKRPLEARTWYNYVGSTARPSRVARRLPDGSVSDVNSTYNYQDNVTWRKDPVGREITSTYATNGIDLLEVRNTTAGRSDLLAQYSTYTAGHLPQTSVDAAGQTTQTTYNAAGQIVTITNAKQEQTTYTYDATGYLQLVTGPVTGATVSYTYDGYGRLRSATPAGEAVVTTDYDVLNRPTRTTYADGTYEETTYDKLDPATRRDRAGRQTRISYNSRRQVIATRDPAGRIIQQQWCGCGSLQGLIDANGNATTWERNVAGQVIREVRADGVTDTDYTYDALGRLATVTDPKQQVTTYTYNLDGSVASVAYTNAQIPTPGVTWTYDPAYARVTTMVDGTGTTTYTYHLPGQLGAGQVATVDGPLTNDVISYSYDQLGRVTTRAINGVPLTLTYDTLGRVQREVNALGTFDYTFDGVSGRLATVTYPNSQTSAYTYFPAAEDHRLQTIHHRYPNGATLSKFDYTYDRVGNILTWRQQADSTAVIWDYGYDQADQLIRAVKHASDPQATVLQRFGYGYDPAGNRVYEQTDDTVNSWTYDRLNRLVSQQAGGLLRVAGTVNEPATVRVQGQPATLDASGVFAGGVQVAPGTTRFTITATDASGNTTTRSYDVDQVGPSKTFTFDANGNLTSDSSRTFEWDGGNRLVRITRGSDTVDIAYDALNRRSSVQERENGGLVHHLKALWCDGMACEERSASGDVTTARFMPQGTLRGATISYQLGDHLGSSRDISDAGGARVARLDYEPFGRRTPNANDPSQIEFAGLYAQQRGGLMTAQLRSYDVDTARWLSEDPGGYVDGPHLYRYALNNPIRFSDPVGLYTIDWTTLRVNRTSSTENICPPNSAGACTQRANAVVLCACSESKCGEPSRAKVTLRMYGTIYVYNGPFVHLRNRPCDHSVTDETSALAHEFSVHIDQGLTAVDPLLTRLENKPYPTADECRADCARTSEAVGALYRGTLHQTQDRENRRCR